MEELARQEDSPHNSHNSKSKTENVDEALEEELHQLKIAAGVTELPVSTKAETEPVKRESSTTAVTKEEKESRQKGNLLSAIRLMRQQHIQPDVIYSIVLNYQEEPERLLVILTDPSEGGKDFF